ncbi:hypothetical protein DFQ28_007285 [Apophysomyces sp. BC1034]|nr:hypothetical protein DFQ30_007190 [Apophysomyces sp. BC1015]KAG0186807.1 hypothetical protein DFQ28_007285 [Apophysomyces sp. BC1034]
MSISPVSNSTCNIKSREYYRRTAKELTTRAPSPYGIIPKRKKRTRSSRPTAAPYLFFPQLTDNISPPPSSLLSSLLNLFLPSTSSKSSSLPVGFMPRLTQKSNVLTCPLDVFAPSSPTITYEAEDSCSCMSTNSSNSSSSNAAGTCDETMISNHINNTTQSTIALSDILCEHYVQQTVMMMDESEGAGDGDDDGLVDVPLATFRMFEAPPSLDEDEQSFIWQSPDREWIPVDCCPKQEPRKSPATTRTLRPPSKRYIPIRAESPVHIRDTRSNAAHLRMLVAEVNMMRAHKIVGPLRPRGYLNKRLDRFVPHRPSRLCEVAA